MYTTCIALLQVTHGIGIIPSNLTCLLPHFYHAQLGCGMKAITPASRQNRPSCCRIVEKNSTHTIVMAPSWVTHDSSIFTHVSSPLAEDRNYNNQSLHKPTTSANTATNTETSTNTFIGVLCALPACVNTARLSDPRVDAFSSTS